MYKVCQSQQAIRRQRQLEAGFLQLMLKRRYEDITVSGLCEFLQIPRKTFYRYFSSKDGALFALLDHTLADFFAMPLPEHRTRGNAIGDLDLYFLFWYEQKPLLDALQRSSMSGILVERANAFALREGHLPRQFVHWTPQIRELALSFSVCGLMSMILQWHHLNFPISPDDMTKLAISMLTKPLLPG